MRNGDYPLTLFYDASRRFCQREVEFLRARDAPVPVATVIAAGSRP